MKVLQTLTRRLRDRSFTIRRFIGIFRFPLTRFERARDRGKRPAGEGTVAYSRYDAAVTCSADVLRRHVALRTDTKMNHWQIAVV